jgi:hypothetical protein
MTIRDQFGEVDAHGTAIRTRAASPAAEHAPAAQNNHWQTN